jgi:hypothetical protein
MITVSASASNTKEKEQKSILDHFTVEESAQERTDDVRGEDEIPHSQVLDEEPVDLKGKGIADPSLSLAAFQYTKQ